MFKLNIRKKLEKLNKNNIHQVMLSNLLLAIMSYISYLYRYIRSLFGIPLCPPKYVIIHSKKLIYIINGKVACSSIQKSLLLSKKITTEGNVHHIISKYNLIHERLTDQENQYFKFTVVRDPFKRLVSFYINKFKNSNDSYRLNNHENYMFGLFKNYDSFETVVKKICLMPDILSDEHFQSQTFLLNGCNCNQIAKFESIDEDLTDLFLKYNIPPLLHLNKSPSYDFKIFYTKELTQLVYERYKEDIITYGYEATYYELMQLED